MLQERIELSTSPLPRECSTTELLQLYRKRGWKPQARVAAIRRSAGYVTQPDRIGKMRGGATGKRRRLFAIGKCANPGRRARRALSLAPRMTKFRPSLRPRPFSEISEGSMSGGEILASTRAVRRDHAKARLVLRGDRRHALMPAATPVLVGLVVKP